MKNSSYRLALMVTLLALPPMTSALAQVRVVQTNSRDGSIHILDPENGEVVARVDGLPINHGVAVAPDQSRNDIAHARQLEDSRKVRAGVVEFERLAQWFQRWNGWIQIQSIQH